MLKFFVWIALSVVWQHLAQGQIDRVHCRNPLGMQDKRITDSQVTASSSHAPGTGPKYARLDREEGDGAWCPQGTAGPNSSEHWLQVELSDLSYLSVIATQGRHGEGRGKEFTPRYRLNYSRDGVSWIEWKNYRGESVLQGNNDSQSVKRRALNPGIPSASFIRFIPATKSAMSVCARIEIYGCAMPTTILQYNIPTPDRGSLGNYWQFDDETYDGKKELRSYHGGLGQLSDGVTGSNDLLQANSHVATRVKGFDYVGWRNNEDGNRDVIMTFFFGDIRNFTAMKIHCVSNKDIRASYFSSVEVTFSLDSRTFPDTPHAPKARFHVKPQSGLRVIVVPLKNAIARYVRARFRIQDEWMLVSEVEFIDATVEIEIDPRRMFPIPASLPEIILSRVQTTSLSVMSTKDVWSIAKASKDWARANRRFQEATSLPTIATVTPKEFGSVAVIACTLAGVIVLLISIVVFLTWRQRRLKKTMTPPRYTYSVQAGSTPNVTLCLTDQRATFSTAACELPPKGSSFQDVSTRRGIATPHEYSDPKDALSDRRNIPPDVTLCGSGAINGIVPIPHYAETSVSNLPPPYVTPPPSTSGAHSLQCTSSTPRRNGLPKYSPPSPSESSTLLAGEPSDDIAFCSELLDECEECGVIEFPRQRFRFIKKLGEGQFGEVQLCKADPILRLYAQQNGITLSGEAGDPVLVAVKLLRGDASPNTREDFLKEAKIMSRMRDPNIVHLLAVCVEEEPYALVTEFMANGDLNGYLRRFKFGDVFCDVKNSNPFLDINDGVHCDVIDDATIRNMYQSDYYRMEGKAILPIRWMPWESVLMGKFSTASDVWAFGVTVWEIFSLCKSQPFQDLSDTDVIDNMNNFYDNTGDEKFLLQPENCPDKVFEVLMRCWRRNADVRPKFDQLYSFFKKQV